MVHVSCSIHTLHSYMYTNYMCGYIKNVPHKYVYYLQDHVQIIFYIHKKYCTLVPGTVSCTHCTTTVVKTEREILMIVY